MVATVGDSIGNELAPAALSFITLLFVILQRMGSSCLGKMEKRYGTYFVGTFLPAVAVLVFNVKML